MATTAEQMQQLAKDLQRLLSDNAAGAGVYEREPTRDESGAVTAKMPFVVYNADFNGEADESGIITVDLFLDVWALGGYSNCYRSMIALDDILDGTVHTTAAGVLMCDRNGLVMTRQQRDPADERIRRMTGQYLIRFAPQL